MENLLRDKRVIFFFVFPGLLIYLAMFVLPIFQTFQYSLFEWRGFGTMHFTGLGNYADLLTDDPGFRKGVVNTLYLFLFLLVFQVPPALFFAVILNRIRRGVRLFKVIYFIPMLMSTVSISLLWGKIYEPNYGLLNELLGGLGLEHLTNEWLSDPSFAINSVSFPIAWQGIGFHLVILYAAIKSIPVQYYEAALIDGAAGWRAEWAVTFPLIRDALKISIVMAAIGALKMFDSIYVMTGGGPADSTMTVAIRMYREAFERNNYGYGSAVAVFLLLECLVIAGILNKALTGERIEF